MHSQNHQLSFDKHFINIINVSSFLKNMCRGREGCLLATVLHMEANASVTLQSKQDGDLPRKRKNLWLLVSVTDYKLLRRPPSCQESSTFYRKVTAQVVLLRVTVSRSVCVHDYNSSTMRRFAVGTRL